MPDTVCDDLQRTQPTLLCRWVQAGVVVCGLAGGLVEFVALQRWRIKVRHRGTPPPWWR